MLLIQKQYIQVNNMKLQIRNLIESDWDIIPQWYKQYNQEGFPRDFLPKNGLGGFMVYKEKPVAAMWLWKTNSKTAIPAVVISDKLYKDKDRSDALQLLIDHTTDQAKAMGFKYSFAWAKPGLLLNKYKNADYYVDESPSYELILKY